jgi:hypothetical protein
VDLTAFLLRHLRYQNIEFTYSIVEKDVDRVREWGRVIVVGLWRYPMALRLGQSQLANGSTDGREQTTHSVLESEEAQQVFAWLAINPKSKREPLVVSFD